MWRRRCTTAGDGEDDDYDGDYDVYCVDDDDGEDNDDIMMVMVVIMTSFMNKQPCRERGAKLQVKIMMNNELRKLSYFFQSGATIFLWQLFFSGRTDHVFKQ